MTLVSKIEPKNIEEAFLHEKRILTMEEELNQFTRNNV